VYTVLCNVVRRRRRRICTPDIYSLPSYSAESTARRGAARRGAAVTILMQQLKNHVFCMTLDYGPFSAAEVDIGGLRIIDSNFFSHIARRGSPFGNVKDCRENGIIHEQAQLSF
jgi:hypothetical protein